MCGENTVQLTTEVSLQVPIPPQGVSRVQWAKWSPPNPDNTGSIVHHSMGLPVTTGCDTAWDQTLVCSNTSSTVMQCLRSLRHLEDSRVALRAALTLRIGRGFTEHKSSGVTHQGPYLSIWHWKCLSDNAVEVGVCKIYWHGCLENIWANRDNISSKHWLQGHCHFYTTGYQHF
jgi:hypothetical protein